MFTIHGKLTPEERRRLTCNQCNKKLLQFRIARSRSLRHAEANAKLLNESSTRLSKFTAVCTKHDIRIDLRRSSACSRCVKERRQEERLRKKYPDLEYTGYRFISNNLCSITVGGSEVTANLASELLTLPSSGHRFIRYTELPMQNQLTDASIKFYKEKILDKFKGRIRVKFNVDPTNKYVIWCMHDCGNKWSTTIENLRASKVGCPTCGREQAAQKIRETLRPLDEVKKRLSRNPKLQLTGEYSNKEGGYGVYCKACSNKFRLNLYRTKDVPKCPFCDRRATTSYIASSWLAEVSKLYNVKLQGGLTQKEKSIRLGTRLFKVDGFHEQSKTVFEFLGDYYHGNPNTSSANKELYKKTWLRLLKLNLSGYSVAYVWEDDYRNKGKLLSGFLTGTTPSFL